MPVKLEVLADQKTLLPEPVETRLGPHHSSRERSLTFPYRSVKVRKKVFVSQFILVHFTFRWTCQPNFSQKQVSFDPSYGREFRLT